MNTRKKPRTQLDIKVVLSIDEKSKEVFSLAQGKPVEATTIDISSLGMGVVTKYYLPKGLIMDLEIEGKSFGSKKSIKVKGEIRYCMYTGISGYRAGIKFINILGEDQDKISKFVEIYERRRSPRVKLSD